VGSGPYWELGETEGKLCATSTDERVDAVATICLDFARCYTDGGAARTLAGHFEGGCTTNPSIAERSNFRVGGCEYD
jgi:hypothetical protein